MAELIFCELFMLQTFFMPWIIENENAICKLFWCVKSETAGTNERQIFLCCMTSGLLNKKRRYFKMPVVFQRLYDNLQGCARWLHLALDNIEGVAGSSSNERSGVCLPRTKISRPSMTESSLLQNILEMGETDEPPGNLAEMYRSLLAIGERLKQGILTAIKKDLAEKEKRAKDGTETSDEEDEGEEEAEEEEEHEEEDEEDDEGSDEDTKKSSKRNHVKGLYFALLDVFFNLPIL